jgi:hypothetical protein
MFVLQSAAGECHHSDFICPRQLPHTLHHVLRTPMRRKHDGRTVDALFAMRFQREWRAGARVENN